ncbi:MAG: tRNA (adenosine(37)-N6)-threonylcarbamoyltransferase complex ATPase subunit type 1 TsaE, partial [Hyphomonadaceae bacterium]
RGGLGAGKTTLARGAVSAWAGHGEDAPSPTFTLIQIYEGPKGPLWHLDLYRLKSPEEAFELGLEEAFATAFCLIEWPERLGGLLPALRLDIRLEPAEAGRTARIEAHGEWRERLHGW